MNLDEQGFPIITPYSQNSTNHQLLPQDHIIPHTSRQYTAVSKFQDNYSNGTPPSMLQNTPRYPETSRTIKEEEDLNTYLYPSTGFRGEMNLNVHHPIHPDHNTIRYHPPHNLYPSDLDSPNTGGLAMSIGMTSSRLESSETRLALGPDKPVSADFRYQMHALQPQHQPHQHGPLPHHQRQNPDLQHMQQGSPSYFPLSMGYSSLDQEHSSPGGGALDRQPQSQLSSVEYDPREPHAQHVSVPAMVYGSLPHEPTTVPGHSQQGVRHDATLNHRGSFASMKGKNPASGSYHTTNSPSSIPMSNNKHNHGTTPSMNTSVPGVHTSSSFSMGPSNSSRWVGHPLGFDMMGSTVGATSVHGQLPNLSSTPVPTSTSSSLRPILRHSDSGNRSSPENSFTQGNSHLHASTSAQTLSSSHSSHSTHSYTNSPSPRLSDNESTVGGQSIGGEVAYPDDRESDQAVDTKETVVRMSEKSPAGRKKVIGAEEEVGESFLAPIKKKKKSKMHRCEVCGKKFPRPSGLRTHMNTHNNEKPYPCGYPGCTRTFGVRSNAKRHLRTHGVFPTPAANPGSTDYVVGFCPPMVLATQSPSHQQSQLHSVEGVEYSTPRFRLLGNNGNIHTQDQGQSDVQHEMSHVPLVKLRWMPPSLTTRTNAGSLREVRDGQQMNTLEECVEEDGGEDEDDFVGGSGIGGVRHMGRGDDMDNRVGDGDEVEFGENISIPLRPVVPSSSSSAVASSSSSNIRSTLSCPVGCMCSPPCSDPSTQGRCRSSHSSSRTFTSISPTTSFSRSHSSLSPSSISAYTQREIEMAGGGGGGGGVYARNRTNSQGYDVRETPTEERNSYLEEGSSHPYHPSQFHAQPGSTVANPTTHTFDDRLI